MSLFSVHIVRDLYRVFNSGNELVIIDHNLNSITYLSIVLNAIPMTINPYTHKASNLDPLF